MEQILSKLSEIETTARHILEEADLTKQALSENAEQKRKDFDKRLDEDTAGKILKIRQELEKEKDAQLDTLRADTDAVFASLDAYYEKNHERLSEKLFQQILDL